jgi:hypothetical protein
MTSTHIPKPTAPGKVDRRKMLRTGGALAGAAALLGGPATAATATQTADTLELDVAMDGRTWRMNRLSEIGPPLMGDTFIIFGSIYPGGALDEDVTGPDAPGSSGRWICKGTFIADATSEIVPSVHTTQQFILGDGISASEGQLDAAPDALLSTGVEGGVEEVHRTLSGGYGEYAGATGSVLQTALGTNDTLRQVGPDLTAPSANYRFVFTFTS